MAAAFRDRPCREPDNHPQTRQDFAIEMAGNDKIHLTQADKTIREVSREQGFDDDSCREQESCDTCVVDVLEGEPDQRDIVLGDEEMKPTD